MPSRSSLSSSLGRLARRRLTIIVAAAPLVLYAWACSDDPASSPTEEDAGTDGASPPNDVDSSADNDSGDVDPADAGDGGQTSACVGNPLAAEDPADAGDAGDAGDGGGVTVDGGALKAIAIGEFLDGPQWIDDDAGGAIVYSEVNAQVIVRNGADGGARTVLRATGPGNLPIGNGQTGSYIYTALARTGGNGGGGSILRMLLDGGAPTGFDAGLANSPNDLVASSKGFVYFTDPGFQTSGISTGVFRLAPDGSVATITKFDGGVADRADGIALTKDEGTLYVGFFDARRITKYTIDAEGMAKDPQTLPITPIDNPTGIAVDVGGNLWIAESPMDTAQVRGRVEVFDATGKRWGEIPFPDSRPTGVAFGGADGKTVYITTERGGDDGTLYVMTSRCAGVR